MNDVVRRIVASLTDELSPNQLQLVEDAIWRSLGEFTLVDKPTTELTTKVSQDVRAYQMFFVAKKVEGMSDKSLAYYKGRIDHFFRVIQRSISEITTDDVRYFLASRKVSATTLNNERRVLSSFFGWLQVEEYITVNPMLRIKNIKQPKVIKSPFTQQEIEEIRDACRTLRERAIVELLLSTGMRREELCNLDISDVDFASGEIIVTGKGNKQRKCFMSATAKKRLRDYLDTRSDSSPSLIASQGNKRLGIGGLGLLIRQIGERAGVKNTHPHRFRRTSATQVLQRGMPIEQVQVMLGHEKIDTTMRYAITADETVKQSHAKYM